LIHFDMGKTEEAERASQEAITLSPNLTEALYQNAQYNAQLRNTKKSIENLEKAIKVDKLYCLKANKDEMFNPIRNEVNRLFGICGDGSRFHPYNQLVTDHFWESEMAGSKEEMGYKQRIHWRSIRCHTLTRKQGSV